MRTQSLARTGNIGNILVEQTAAPWRGDARHLDTIYEPTGCVHKGMWRPCLECRMDDCTWTGEKNRGKKRRND